MRTHDRQTKRVRGGGPSAALDSPTVSAIGRDAARFATGLGSRTVSSAYGLVASATVTAFGRDAPHAVPRRFPSAPTATRRSVLVRLAAAPPALPAVRGCPAVQA
jgi:hypothetical protein